MIRKLWLTSDGVPYRSLLPSIPLPVAGERERLLVALLSGSWAGGAGEVWANVQRLPTAPLELESDLQRLEKHRRGIGVQAAPQQRPATSEEESWCGGGDRILLISICLGIVSHGAFEPSGPAATYPSGALLSLFSLCFLSIASPSLCTLRPLSPTTMSDLKRSGSSEKASTSDNVIATSQAAPTTGTKRMITRRQVNLYS